MLLISKSCIAKIKNYLKIKNLKIKNSPDSPYETKNTQADEKIPLGPGCRPGHSVDGSCRSVFFYEVIDAFSNSSSPGLFFCPPIGGLSFQGAYVMLI